MMSSDQWVLTRLDAHFQIKHGYAFKGEYFADAGPFIVLTPGNFFDEGGFKSKNQEKYYTGEVPDDYILQRGDLLVAMTEQAEGLLGSSALIPQDNLYLHNQRLGLVVNLDEDVLDKRFLYYLFNTRSVRNQIRATASGTKVRHTSPSRIGEVQVILPPIEVQRRIVDVVSAYDDLIENNTRRIAILEEMSRAIYHEWFVDFRFPGHARVEMVESELGPVPSGWSIKTMSEVADVIDCLHSKKPQATDEGNLLLQVYNIGSNGKLDLTKPYWIDNEDYDLWTSRIEVREGDCVITNVGRVGAVAQVPRGITAAIGRNMTAVRPRTKYISPTYLIESLLSRAFKVL